MDETRGKVLQNVTQVIILLASPLATVRGIQLPGR
jgi:hypothetical protein